MPANSSLVSMLPFATIAANGGMNEATSDITTTTLVQGLGAVVWASPQDQAKHEAFVVAPQYAAQLVNDQSEASSYFDTTVDLVTWLTTQYSIDTNRLSTTGDGG